MTAALFTPQALHLTDHICTTCGGVGVCRESRRCSNGSRRRRLHCQQCGDRWTTFDGERPQHHGWRPAIEANRLLAAQVKRILLATGSISAIARETGHCRQTVAAVLRGESHAHVCRDLPRRSSKSCLDCGHWQGRCGLGFPDPEDEGPGFASDCASYCQA